MSDILIREWTDEDLSAIRNICWETWVATYATFVPVADLRSYFDREYAIEALREFLRSAANRGLLALVADVPAAFIRTHWEEKESRFYVSSLYVLPEHQGHGLGGLLMAAAEQQAVKRDADAIWLGVMEQNVRTLEWYRKQGFVFVEEAPFVMGNSTVNHFIGFKKIQTDRL
jgi:ribosomal protein S18 acetylase RimI-like enzyme